MRKQVPDWLLLSLLTCANSPSSLFPFLLFFWVLERVRRQGAQGQNCIPCLFLPVPSYYSSSFTDDPVYLSLPWTQAS